MTDLLPPGSAPAWADGDPANQIAQIWAGDMWPSLWPRMIHKYANAAARDADLAGLGPSDVAFAYLQDLKIVSVWTGAAWGAVGGRRASGQVTITPSAANTPTAQGVVFPVGLFTAIPKVTVTPATSVPGTTVTGWAMNNVTTSGCDIIVTRTNTTNTVLHWVAVQEN